MLTIRLQRIGKTKHPIYRLIVSEKARDTHDKYLENLGSFNPHSQGETLVSKAERIKYWLSKGAATSNTVHNLLVKNGIISGKKKKVVFLSTKRKAKVAEKSKKQNSQTETQPVPATT